MTRKFDVIAIGTGSSASTIASRRREAGWQVAVVDSRPFGGTCALRGCDPKKVLVGAAEAVDWTRRMKGKGIQAAKLQIDWPELMRFKRSFTEPVPKRREEVRESRRRSVPWSGALRRPNRSTSRGRNIGGTVSRYCGRRGTGGFRDSRH
jgi:pyruvate/2-oxoglutarate dehydrogenase complex dihydrolipoamide dehydrogenase (E3) component